MGRIRRRRELTERQIAFARSPANFPIKSSDLRKTISWEELNDAAVAELKRRGVTVETKRRGLRSLAFWRDWESSTTMLPAPEGPLLLARSWATRPIDERATTLWHEITHHEQDRKLAWYEAGWVDPGWRWALELQCYGMSIWCKVASRVYDRDPHTQGDLAYWIEAKSRSMRRAYRLRRYSAEEIRSHTADVLQHHARSAVLALSKSKPLKHPSL